MSERNRKKLVIVTSRFPFPLEKGDKLRIYHQIKHLSTSNEIHLYSFSDQPVNDHSIEELNKYCTSITLFPLSKVSRILGLIWSFVNSFPFQVGYFYNPFHKKKLLTQIQALQPDIIYCQLIRVAEYVKDYHNCPKILDYMDAFSKGMERRMRLGKWYNKWLFSMESTRLRRYEQRIFDYFEEKLIISEQDKNFIAHPKRSSICSVPNGIDSRFFEEIQIDPNYELVFVGNLSYAPNIEAVYYIKDNILPLSKNCRILISGAQPTGSMIKMCEAHPQISLMGWVDDIRFSYKSGKIFVAPMMIGTGMQNKLLEAMALGIPCITTSLANNAIGARHNETILVAETPNDFSRWIKVLLEDKDTYDRISENARKFVENQFQWSHSTDQIQSIIDELSC